MRPAIFMPSFDLSILNGRNGFAINGLSDSDWTGIVSDAGDVNNDGIADVIIGAFSARSTGASFVLFGGSKIGSNGSLDLSSLNGSNGFVIWGVKAYERCGNSVSYAGDVNNDGISDLIIGAPMASPDGKNAAGVSYVIFGNPKIGMGGSLDLSTLNGINGFVIKGVNVNDTSGSSVGNAGDLNGDGITDLIIGAPSCIESRGAGTSYIVFGKRGIGSSGIFDLSSLNGINGFAIKGVSKGDCSGSSVSGAGDINGDGITDLLIGAPHANYDAGISYLVFGKVGIGSTGVLNLSTLDGKIGCAIKGVVAPDYSGESVRGAGDINNDGIADLIIGAPYDAYWFYPRQGMSYVVFGKRGFGGSGVFELSTLNGTNGFVINGDSLKDSSGEAVSGAGDFNKDGITDLLIGAPDASPHGITKAGSTYMVFGKTNIGSTGKFELSSLNGENGFAMYGLTFVAVSGRSVSGAGDINADGIADIIIGAPLASPAGSKSDPGVCYVVFGDAIPKTVANRLIIAKGKTALLDNNDLKATRADKLDLELIFTIDQLTHGNFEQIDRPGIYITSFSQESVVANKIQFIHDSSNTAPTYSIKVTSRIAANSFEAADIHFIHLGPKLVNNTLTLNQGESLVLNTNMVSAIDLDGQNFEPDLLFRVSQLQYGQFVLADSPLKPIYQFRQLQITHHEIQFIHDGTANCPTYSISVSDGTDQDAISTPPKEGKINFNFAPVLENNRLIIAQGRTHILTSSDLSASDPDDDPGSLIFQISNLQHGRFSTKQEPATPILTFMQNQIHAMNIIFVHDGTQEAPSYAVSVSDGRITTLPQPSRITFDVLPVLIRNSLTIIQGQSKVLTINELSASDRKVLAEELIFIASAVRYGRFEELATPGQIVMQFTQQRVMKNQIQFIATGNAHAPCYNISVSNGLYTTQSSAANIVFYTENVHQDYTVRNAIIGSTISGFFGLAFFGIRLYLGYKAAKNLQKILEGNDTELQKRLVTFQREVLRPVTKNIFDYIRTTNFLGYRSDETTKEYITAIGVLLAKLDQQGVNLNLRSLNATQQNKLFSAITNQTRKQVITGSGWCSCSFFKPEITPTQIEEKAEQIAAAVHQELKGPAPVLNINS